jgi:hypothetical protein
MGGFTENKEVFIVRSNRFYLFHPLDICLTHNKSSDVKARFLKMSMTIERGNEKN